MDRKIDTHTWYAVGGFLLTILVIVGIILLTSRKTSDQAELDNADRSMASVETVDVAVNIETFPFEVVVTAGGNFPNGCTKVSDIRTIRTDNTFFTAIEQQNDIDSVCTQALVPFQEIFTLEVVELPAGQYDIDVNGIRNTFVLPIDNTLEFESLK